MNDETDIALHDVIQANTVAKVFEVMLRNNGNQKQACEEVGISEKTFVRAVRNNPIWIKELHGFVLSKFAHLTDALGDAHTDAIDILRKELYRMKALLEIDIVDPNDLPISFEDRIKITNEIIRIDKYLMTVLGNMLPKVKEKTLETGGTLAPSDKDKREMEEIFKSLKGANRVTVTKSQQVIEFSSLPSEQKPPTEFLEADSE